LKDEEREKEKRFNCINQSEEDERGKGGISNFQFFWEKFFNFNQPHWRKIGKKPKEKIEFTSSGRKSGSVQQKPE
jgi:hypothetical protein